MRIVVTDVTRMAEGYCCVAGIDRDTGEHIRPVLGERLRRDLLAPSGPFALGAIVDLGEVQDAGNAPMVEDRRFEPRAARRIGTLSPDDFWERVLLTRSATRLHGIFGNRLEQPRGSNAAMPESTGTASLGSLTPAGSPTLAVEEHTGGPRLRMRFTDGRLSLNTAVTDIRFFDNDHPDIPLPDVVEDVSERIAAGAECVLSVGLGRIYRRTEPPWHWLQVNGVHLADDPLWTVSGR